MHRNHFDRQRDPISNQDQPIGPDLAFQRRRPLPGLGVPHSGLRFLGERTGTCDLLIQEGHNRWEPASVIDEESAGDSAGRGGPVE